MKKIKFRGLTKKGKEWIYGHYTEFGNYNKTKTISPQIMCGENNCCVVRTVIKGTVGQYTGLKDAKGTEIYEGDTFDVHCDRICYERTTVVGFVTMFKGTYTIQFTHPKDNKEVNLILFRFLENEKVINGNIHENPELLGVV